MLAMLRFAWRAPLHQGAREPALAAAADVTRPGEQENAWRTYRCHSAYWPQHELDSFILQMAGHGRAVHTAMMLGDCAYAREKLAAAGAIGCPRLRALSERLSAYFDHPLGSAETH